MQDAGPDPNARMQILEQLIPWTNEPSDNLSDTPVRMKEWSTFVWSENPT